MAKITRAERIAGLLGGATPKADAGTLVDTMVLMLAADGKKKAGELEEATAIAARLPAFKGKPETDAQKAVEASLAAIKKEGRKGRLQSLAKRLTASDDREDAFRLAAAVRFADAEVADEEDDLLVSLRDALQIDVDRAETLLADVESRLFRA